LRAFHLSASRNQVACAEVLNFEFYTLFRIVSFSSPQPAKTPVGKGLKKKTNKQHKTHTPQ